MMPEREERINAAAKLACEIRIRMAGAAPPARKRREAKRRR